MYVAVLVSNKHANYSFRNMLALRAKTEAKWVLAHAPSPLSEFLFFRYL